MRIPRALLLVCVALLLPLTAIAGGDDEAGDVIKVGVLHSLSGTMSISEVAVKGRHHSGDQRDQCGRRSARQADRTDHRGRRFRLAHLRRKGAQADRARPGPGGVRLLDLGQPQGGVAGIRRSRPPAVLPGAVRGAGSVQEHHLYRGGAQPADHAGGVVVAAGEGHQVLPARLGLRIPAHRQQDHQDPARGGGRHHGRGGVHSAWPHRVRHRDQQDPGREPGCDLQHPERRQQRGLLQAAQGCRYRSGGHSGDVGERCRRGDQGHRRRVHRGPPGGLELLPEHGQPQERGLRGALQGGLRRGPRHRRSHRGGLLRCLPVGGSGARRPAPPTPPRCAWRCAASSSRRPRAWSRSTR